MEDQPGTNEKNAAWNFENATPLIEQVFEHGIIKPGDRVLDAGCGFGRNSNWLASHGAEVCAVNINADELSEAKKRAEDLGLDVSYIEASVTELPFKDQSFDSIVDSGCTHQLSGDDQVKAQQEFERVLKPGGYIIYFGFSKKHPAKQEESPMFRDVEDVEELAGDDFQVIASKEISWKPDPKEQANFSEHVGINAVLQKKSEE